MRITVIGRGRVGGGLAARWRAAGHEVATLGRAGGEATGSDVVVVAVPAANIRSALRLVSGLDGQITVDTSNAFGHARDDQYPSLSHQIQALVGGPSAKAFSTNFASAYPHLDGTRPKPSDLFASDPGARAVTEQLIRDAGFDPVYAGALDPGARLIEDSTGLTRALAASMGAFFYRCALPQAW
jgi:predicted dinucleotide-binding enzyme